MFNSERKGNISMQKFCDEEVILDCIIMLNERCFQYYFLTKSVHLKKMKITSRVCLISKTC